VSGSSPAGVAAADSIGATAVKYPEPPLECTFSPSRSCGVRVGIIARANDTAAWEIAHQRFPDDRRGQITHELVMRISDSSWHKQLSELGRTYERHDTYWLGTFKILN